MDLPIELFLSFIAFAVVMGIIGLWKRIPIMMFIAGAVITFWAITTDNIIMNDRIDNIVATENTFNITTSTEQVVVYSYNVITGSQTFNVDSGGTNRRVWGEYASNSSSILVGDIIQCINTPLQDIGTASINTITIGILDANGAITTQFGSINASSIVDSPALEYYEFCLPEGVTYIVQSGDRIGGSYDFDATSQGIASRTDIGNPFDGVISFEQRMTNGVWLSSTTNDINMQLYRYEEIPNDVQISGIGGIYTYENNELPFTEYPKILFGLIASIFMLAGALVWKFEEN